MLPPKDLLRQLTTVRLADRLADHARALKDTAVLASDASFASFTETFATEPFCFVGDGEEPDGEPSEEPVTNGDPDSQTAEE